MSVITSPRFLSDLKDFFTVTERPGSGPNLAIVASATSGHAMIPVPDRPLSRSTACALPVSYVPTANPLAA